MNVRFRPGPGTALVTDALIALIGGAPGTTIPHPATGPLLVALETAAGPLTPRTVLDVLRRLDAASLPSFALAVRDQGGWRLFVRGAASVADERGTVSAPDALGWNEALAPSLGGASFTLGESEELDADAWWVSAGRIPAIALTVIDDASHAPEGGAGDAPAPNPAVAPMPAPAPAPAPSPAPAPAPAPAPSPSPSPSPSPTVAPTVDPRVDAPVAEAAPPPPPAFPSPVRRPAPEPPPAAPAPAPTPPPPPTTPGAGDPTLIDLGAPPTPGPPPPAPAPSGLIDGAPAELAVPVAPSDASAGPPTAEPRLGDHDGHTVHLGPELQAAVAAADAGAAARTVQAVHCRTGHANPPHATVCLWCGGPIDDHRLSQVARPILGELRFDDGTAYPIDRPMVIGRQPDPGVARTSVGQDDYRTVAIADPHLSRSHAVVQIEEWHVLVVDLGSSNQTSIQAPGQEPITLRPGAATMIAPGMRVSFGPSTHATYVMGPA